jgi:excisionase family DNA binding protein
LQAARLALGTLACDPEPSMDDDAAPGVREPHVPRTVQESLLTALEVAERLQLSRSAVYKLSRTGQLPGIAVTGGAVRKTRRWLERDVDAFIESRRSA